MPMRDRCRGPGSLCSACPRAWRACARCGRAVLVRARSAGCRRTGLRPRSECAHRGAASERLGGAALTVSRVGWRGCGVVTGSGVTSGRSRRNCATATERWKFALEGAGRWRVGIPTSRRAPRCNSKCWKQDDRTTTNTRSVTRRRMDAPHPPGDLGRVIAGEPSLPGRSQRRLRQRVPDADPRRSLDLGPRPGQGGAPRARTARRCG